MNVRRAVPGDGAAIRGICRGIYPRGDYVEDMLGVWMDLGSLYVAEDGRVVGVFAVSVRDETAWLQGSRIDAPLQGAGLGTAMYGMAEKIALDLGAGGMGAFAGSERGLGMLEKMGYRTTGRGDMYVLGGGDVPCWDEFGDVTAGGMRGRYLDSWTLRDLNDADKIVRGDDVTVKIAGSGCPGTSLTVLDSGGSGIANLAGYISARTPGGRPQYRWWRRLVVLCIDEPREPFADAGFCAVGSYPIMTKSLK